MSKLYKETFIVILGRHKPFNLLKLFFMMFEINIPLWCLLELSVLV